MEKERVLARIAEAMRINGIELVESDVNGMSIREKATGCQFWIQIAETEAEGIKE